MANLILKCALIIEFANSKNEITQDFLYVELQTSEFYKYSVSVSMRTGMPKINRDELNQFSSPVYNSSATP